MHSTSPTPAGALQAADLRPLARQAMQDAGFITESSDVVPSETAATPDLSDSATIRDMRSILWSSIDNVESRDLDQVEWAEKLPDDDIRLLIGIADVDELVPRGSALDKHAFANTTSVYTGIETFPMLPRELSEGTTSLLPDCDRLAVVVSLRIEPDGTVAMEEVFRASVRNHAKLAYEEVGTWLEEPGTPAPEITTRIPRLQEQLLLQAEAATRLREARLRSGALGFETVEARPVVEAGRVTGLTLLARNRARDLIESFMVTANGAIAGFLRAQNSLSIARVVREPDRWPRIVLIAKKLGETLPAEPDSLALAQFLEKQKVDDPTHFADVSLSVLKLLGPGQYEVERPDEERIGHFGLAVHCYTHSTAPNRRYVDLVTQRLVKACLSSAPSPYTEAQLEAIVERCTERENAARKVERLMRKVAAASLISNRIGEVFEAIVTGASPKGTYVRLIEPPVEGRVTRGEAGLDVGEKTRVRLISTDAERGFIDFENAD